MIGLRINNGGRIISILKMEIPKQLQNRSFRFLLLRPKDKKPLPQMADWQNKNCEFDNPVLQYHINGGGNYGIIGGYGNLILIDADSEEITKICENMPETFTVKTGSPEHYKKHFFYIADKPIKPIRLSKEKLGDLGDVRSVGQYVVAPGSIHPSGNEYKVLKNIGIKRITEKEILEIFKDYVDGNHSTEFKKFEINTTLRNSRFIRECRVPDYCAKNRIKGDSSKNWTLFPYIVDILHNRQSSLKVHEEILKKQNHNIGAMKGWVIKAKEGKLMKCSCRKMKEYLLKFHPEEIEKICGDCPLYKTQKIIEELNENKNYSKLQKKVLTQLALKDKDKATELIVEEIERKNFIYTTRDDIRNEMWIYNNGIYVPQGKSFVREFCRKILMEAFTPQLANNVILKVDADTQIEYDKFFSTNYIYEVPLLNGILNIRTRELTPFDPKKIFFNKVPIEYNPSAECENIIEHLKNVLQDETDVPVLLELFGYLLLKEYRIEKALMFVGNGRNGKSKTLELMKRFIGAENCSALPLKALHEESFSLSELFGKMCNLSADLSNTDLKETGMIKSLIGRDTVQAKRKFLKDLNFVNYAKMIFATNELPRVYDTTDGFWTKWVLLQFPYKFVTQKEYNSTEDKSKLKIIDTDIIEKISTPEELSGLLNLALDSLDRILQQKDFSYSKGTKEVREMWIRQSDSFSAFCMDCLEESSEGKVLKKDLRKKYHIYCKKHRVRGSSDKVIKITLENNFGVIESRNMENGYFWEGITFK